MKKGKKLLVVFLATLIMVIGAVSMSYASTDHYWVKQSGSTESEVTYHCNTTSHSHAAYAKIVGIQDAVIYDGQPHGGDVEWNFSTGANIYFNCSNITYTGTKFSGENYNSTTAPTEAGFYVATATVTYESQTSTSATQTISQSFRIYPKALTVSGITAVDKQYDGTSDAVLKYYGIAQYEGIVGNDNVFAETATGYFYDGTEPPEETNKVKNVGNNIKVKLTADTLDKTQEDITKAVTKGSIVLGGNQKYNYYVGAVQNDLRADITPIVASLEWEHDNADVAAQATDADKLKQALVYNGKEQKPTATITNLVDADKNEAIKVAVSGGQINAGKNYVAKAVNITGSKNYVLGSTNVETEYNIYPRKVSFTWKSDMADVETAGNRTNGLVYNGEEQHPTATPVASTGDDTKEGLIKGDDLQVTYNGSQIHANAHLETYYQASATIGNPNYTLGGQLAARVDTTEDRDYKIYPKSVESLSWTDTHNGETKPIVNQAEFTYNGKWHEINATPNPEAIVGEDKVNVTVSGSPIENKNKWIDANAFYPGTADATIFTAVSALDNTDYTLYQDARLETPVVIDTQTLTFNINQLPVIAKWSPEPTTFVYDADYHQPTATIENKVTEREDTGASDVANLTLDESEHANVGEYTTTVAEIAGDQALDYTTTDGQNLSVVWTITKRPLAVIANANTIWYGNEPANNGVTYKGLINGNANEHDDEGGVPGKYIPEGESEPKPVVEGTPVFTYSYAKNGKPGTYTIYVSGLKSDNYDVQPVAGTLTVLDRVSYLNARGTKKGSKGILVSWNGVTGAASYDVYASLCNTKKKHYTPVYVGSTAGTSFKVKKIGKKKLKTKTPYKYYVVAKDGAGNPITRSPLGHFITNNVKGKQVNAKSMAVNTHVVSIGKGGTAGLGASYTKAKKGKKYKLIDGIHAPLTRFASENPEVATVDANGVVTGVGSGWTRVYVQGVSGMWETVEVYVQ